jgi:hypothetical protein
MKVFKHNITHKKAQQKQMKKINSNKPSKIAYL